VTKKSAQQEYDFAFRRYLEREHSLCISANSTDYKPTSKAELDDLTKSSIASFERACALLDALSGPEREHMKEVYLLLHPRVASYQADELASFFLENQDPTYKSRHGDMMKFVDFVGPRWLEAYLAYGKLRAIFRPDAKKLPMITGRQR